MVENFLLNLPETLTRKLLVDWLYITDVVRVDSAYCSRKQRIAFCETAFSSTVYHHFHSSAAALSNNTKIFYMEWLLRRRVHIINLSVPMEKHDLNELFEQYFSNIGDSLRDINLSDRVGHGMCYRLIDYIAKNCPNLVTLSVGSCSMATPPEDFPCLFESCRLLRKLSIISCEAPDRQYRSTNVYATIAAHCGQLESLEWENCNLNDAVINSLSNSGDKLRYLSLSCNPSISDTALAVLMTRCPNLTDFNISRCNAVTDETLVAIATHCPLLQRLQIDHLQRVTNTAVTALQIHAPQLRYLSMVGCAGVTLSAVAALSASNKQLICKTKPSYPAVIAS